MDKDINKDKDINQSTKDNLDRDTTKPQDKPAGSKPRHRFTPIVPKTKTKWEWFLYRLTRVKEKSCDNLLLFWKQFNDFFFTMLKNIVEFVELIVEPIVEKIKVKFFSPESSAEEDDICEENEEGFEWYFKPFSENEWHDEDFNSLPPVVLKDNKPFWNYYGDDPYQFDFACMVLAFPISKKDEVMAKVSVLLKTRFQDSASNFFIDEGQFVYRFDLYLAKYYIQRGVFDFNHELKDWYLEELTDKLLYVLNVAKRMKFVLLDRCRNRVYYRRVKRLFFFFQRRSSFEFVDQACYELFQRKQQKEYHTSYGSTEIWAQKHSKLIFGIPRPRGDCFHLYVYDVGFDSLQKKQANLESFEIAWRSYFDPALHPVEDPIVFSGKSLAMPPIQPDPDDIEFNEEDLAQGNLILEYLGMVVFGIIFLVYWWWKWLF